MLRKIFTIFGTLGILVGGFGLIALIGSMKPQIERQEAEKIPPTVFFAVAEAEATTLTVTAQGEVRPRTDINLTAQVAGRIVDVADVFVNGGAFEKNDTLLRIEDADFRAAAAGAKARLAQAEEALRREEAESELAARDYADLGRVGEASALTLRKPQLAQAQANFEAAKADYDAAQLNLQRTRVRAPFDGRVRERIVGLGQYVSPGNQLGRIFSTDIAEIRLALTDADLAKLGLPLAYAETEDNPGPAAVLSTYIAGDIHYWNARIARTDGAIDPATRQISAIAVVDDPYGEGAAEDGTPLAIGLFVDAAIDGVKFDNAMVLPRSALHGRDNVYVINNQDILERRQVRVVSADRDTVTVTTGIAAGERIVTSPLRGAGDGDAVKPSDPNAANANNAPLTARASSEINSAGDAR